VVQFQYGDDAVDGACCAVPKSWHTVLSLSR
jgi:hypothetical protein